MPAPPQLGSAHESSKDLESSVGPQDLSTCVSTGDKQSIMSEAIQRMDNVTATADALLEIGKFSADHVDNLPSEDLVYVNELKSEIIHDHEKITMQNEQAAVSYCPDPSLRA